MRAPLTFQPKQRGPLKWNRGAGHPWWNPLDYEKMLGALRDLAGTTGKKILTRDDERRIQIELDKFPGEFRDMFRVEEDKFNRKAKEAAQHDGTTPEIVLRMAYRGNERAMRKYKGGESDICDPNRGIPAYDWGIDAVDSAVCPS